MIREKLIKLALVGLLASPLGLQAKETVDYKSSVSGEITYTDSGGMVIHESGIASHLGNFTMSGGTDEQGVMWMTISAANEDKLFAVVVYASENMDTVEIVVYDGTGRFEHATGNITAKITISSVNLPNIAYTATGSGTITTVGASKK